MKQVLNGQSAAKPLLNGEGSTTIPEGSTPRVSGGKRPIYLAEANVIYKITCLPTNKCYIGSASNYRKRIGTHKALLRKGRHKNIYLQNAYNKYGEDEFSFAILVRNLKKELLPIVELFYINKFKALNRKFGFNINKDTRSRRGTNMPESAKIKIGNFWRGKKFSTQRILDLRKRAAKLQGKAVICFDKDFNFVKEFESISEASRATKVGVSSISIQCSKLSGQSRKRKDSKYIFRYKDIV